jgi:hypothetical protein
MTTGEALRVPLGMTRGWLTAPLTARRSPLSVRRWAHLTDDL